MKKWTLNDQSEAFTTKLDVLNEFSDEEDDDYYNEVFMDDLESGDTGALLDRATELQA